MKIIIIITTIKLNIHDIFMIRRTKLMNRDGGAEGQVWRVQEQIGGWLSFKSSWLSFFCRSPSLLSFLATLVALTLCTGAELQTSVALRLSSLLLLLFSLTETNCSNFLHWVVNIIPSLFASSPCQSLCLSWCHSVREQFQFGDGGIVVWKGASACMFSLFTMSGRIRFRNTGNYHHYQQQQQHGWEKGKLVWSEP